MVQVNVDDERDRKDAIEYLIDIDMALVRVQLLTGEEAVTSTMRLLMRSILYPLVYPLAEGQRPRIWGPPHPISLTSATSVPTDSASAAALGS